MASLADTAELGRELIEIPDGNEITGVTSGIQYCPFEEAFRPNKLRKLVTQDAYRCYVAEAMRHGFAFVEVLPIQFRILEVHLASLWN